MSNEHHGADAVEPDHNSTDDQTTLESANAAAGTTAATSGIIETAGAHAPVLDEATPDITDEGAQTDLSRKTFADFGVEPEICEALDAKGITHPFPIQALTLPVALEGQDIIGQAKTGTGKTLGFGIPLLMDTLGPGEEGWDEDPASGSPQALVILPTRELAKQVAEELSTAAAKRTARPAASSTSWSVACWTWLTSPLSSWTRPTRCWIWASCRTWRRSWPAPAPTGTRCSSAPPCPGPWSPWRAAT